MPNPIAAFVLQGRSDFDALSGFNDELSLSLRTLGVEPFTVNLLDWDQSLQTVNHVLNTYDRRHLIAAFSFSGIGAELGEDMPEGNIWRNLKIPMVTWMLDHPSYILKRHTMSNPAVARLYSSTDFMYFQRDYIKTPGRNVHCRLGVFTQGQEMPRRTPQKGDRPLIIFAKSLGNPDDLKQRWAQLPKPIIRIIRDAIDHYWGETERWNGVLNSVLKAARNSGVELQNDLPLFSFLFAQVDQYFRHHKSSVLIKELLSLPVTIYGRGMEHIEANNVTATLLPPISYQDLTAEYRKALAVISMNPNVENDCHDRVYHALGAGALPISDNNPWWEENFSDLVPFSYNFCDRPIAVAINKIIENPEDAANVAWHVGQKARTDRPFHSAVVEAIDWALTQRYFEFDFVNPVDGYVR